MHAVWTAPLVLWVWAAPQDARGVDGAPDTCGLPGAPSARRPAQPQPPWGRHPRRGLLGPCGWPGSPPYAHFPAHTSGGGLSSRKTRKGTYSSDGGRGRQIKAQKRSQEPPDRTRHSGKGPRKTAGSGGADGAPEQVRPAGTRAAASTPAPQRPSGKDASVQVTAPSGGGRGAPRTRPAGAALTRLFSRAGDG